MAMLAPWEAKRSAIARPILRLAPVIKAVRPCNRPVINPFPPNLLCMAPCPTAKNAPSPTNEFTVKWSRRGNQPKQTPDAYRLLCMCVTS